MQNTYWDLQVLDTNNYVSADGLIHHNSGKSSGCVIDLMENATHQTPGRDGIRRTRFAVVRNTLPQLRDTTMRTLFKWLPPTVPGNRFTKHEGNYIVRMFKGVEIEFMFRALDRPDQIANLLSLELTGAWVNEAREVPWTIIEALDGRIDRYPPREEGGATRPTIIMDTNPPDTDSDWYRVFEERLTVDGERIGPDNFHIFKQPSGLSAQAENMPNLSPGYYTNLAEGKGKDYVKVYIHGQYGYVMEHKPVYDNYNDELHCSEQANVTPGLTVHVGWDFGLTPAVVFSQLHPSGRWVIFDELMATSMGIERFADQVLRYCGENLAGYNFLHEGDPAGSQRTQTDEKTCYQILEAKKIIIRPGLQTVTKRLESVRKPMNTLIQGKPQMQLHTRCKMLRKGFMGKYYYRRIHSSVSGKFSDEPEKNAFSHPHDAVQYTATILFGEALTAARDNENFFRKIDYDNRGIR